MGERSRSEIPFLKDGAGEPPRSDEFELTLMGSGYGESIVSHIGGGVWVVVDSCLRADGEPQPLSYLAGLGVSAEAVSLIVATHWHDDHIGGLSRLVERCKQARFVCSAALAEREFLGIVASLDDGSVQKGIKSGVREMRRVFSLLNDRRVPHRAMANQRIFQAGECEVWSLSPGHQTFNRFLKSLAEQIPRVGEAKGHVLSLSPNEVSVALWLRAGDVVALLGGDLERDGWRQILASEARPAARASAFKVPHHGSQNADEPAVWEELLVRDPVAALTPWNLGGRSLPLPRDVERIVSYTSRAYATGLRRAPSRTKRPPMVERELRQRGGAPTRTEARHGLVRLRRSLKGCCDWRVETFGAAIRLGSAAA